MIHIEFPEAERICLSVAERTILLGHGHTATAGHGHVYDHDLLLYPTGDGFVVARTSAAAGYSLIQ